MREYETIIVLDPTLDESRVNQEIETVNSVIMQGGGEVIEIRALDDPKQRWGRRRLAYEIRRKREGIYSLIRFKSERGVLDELEKRFKLNESLMRHLTVLSDGPMVAPSPEDHYSGERRHEGRRREFREFGDEEVGAGVRRGRRPAAGDEEGEANGRAGE